MNPKYCFVVYLSLIFSLAVPSLAAPIGKQTPLFDGARAMQILESLTLRGERYPGAPKRAAEIAHLAEVFRKSGAEVSLQPFRTTSPIDDKAYDFQNIIARFEPKRSARVLLGTHYDTRSVGDLDSSPRLRAKPIPGANDGTSGVALLIELARHLETILKSKDWGVDIVLFDAEDLGTRQHLDGFSRGAKHFAKRLSAQEVKAYVAAIVVDMVGEKGLILKREAYSRQRAEALTNLIWRYGQARAPEVFVKAKGGGVIDDHLPLLERGIPSTLLIDLDYPQWHTSHDKPEYCSAKSLDAVGDTLEAYLRDLKL